MLFEGVEVNTRQTAKPKTIPAPVGGLNGRDSLANMAETDAYFMDNVFPGTSTCKVREGCFNHHPNIGVPVTSLEVFGGATADKMLAFGKPYIYDVTVPNVKTELKADLVSDEVISNMFSTVADSAQFLIITTGFDLPMSYNGAVIADLVMTGMADPPQSINYVCSFKGRLYFAVRDRLGFYYLPPGQIQGAMEWYDLGQVAIKGGFLRAIATYSDDAGDGPNDYIVFITNKGEYIMYDGSDPGDATAWQLVGRYKSSEPIGRKCVVDYAGDLIVLTTEGAIQFSQIRKLADTRFELTAMTSKLGDILAKLNVYRDVFGWDMELYPVGGMFIVSVPGSTSRTGRYWHFVMNTTTQAWTRFWSKHWDGQCWAMLNKKLYFGRYDGAIRGVGGDADMNEEINFDVKQAYNYFGTPAHKHFKWAQFLVKSEAPVVLSSRLSVDYRERAPETTPAPISTSAGGIWDVSFWDTATWGESPYTQRWIQAYGDYGVAASHWLSGKIKGATFEWFSTEHVYEEAEGLL